MQKAAAEVQADTQDMERHKRKIVEDLSPDQQQKIFWRKEKSFILSFQNTI